MPQDWNYGTDHMGIASRALVWLREGSERYGLVSPAVLGTQGSSLGSKLI